MKQLKAYTKQFPEESDLNHKEKKKNKLGQTAKCFHLGFE